MIKINKNLSAIPDSIQLPFAEFFPNGIPRPPQTTHSRRVEIINTQKYIDELNYNNRYKQVDVKSALKELYKNKCAFCEQRVEQGHIEHYRPKTIYYWLAFSWDNLIFACSLCNENKGKNFEIENTQVTFQNSDENIKHIHTSSSSYDKLEQPKMVNPEVTDPSGKIKFDKRGFVESDDERFAYTIKICQIDRADLNDERRKLLNTFKEDIQSILVEFKNPDEQRVAIETIVRKFIRDSKDSTSSFLAFKRFAIDSKWLNEIIKEMN